MTPGTGTGCPRGRTTLALLLACVLAASACAAPAPEPTRTPAPSPSASPPAARPSPTATVPVPTGPIASLPSGCPSEASDAGAGQRVSISEIDAQTYPTYDVLVFGFDRAIPEYAITQVEPPFSADPSGLPLVVDGESFFSIVLSGASIVDDEYQPVYRGPTDFHPGLPRIRHVVLAGDFEAVSHWIVGLAAAACLVVQAAGDTRLVIGFVDVGA